LWEGVHQKKVFKKAGGKDDKNPWVEDLKT
jgi:hypothetical protein